MSSLPRSVRRTLVAGGAVLILGGAAVGIAAAQTPSPSTTNQQGTYQKFVAALATRLGIDQGKLDTAISQARTDAGMPAGNGFPKSGAGRGPRAFIPFDPNALASFLGTTPQDLRTALQTKTLAQVASDHGKSTTDLSAEIKKEDTARIDQAVAAGHLTNDQANQMKAALDQRISQMINQVMPKRPAGVGAPGLRGGFNLQQLATFLGTTPQDLRTALQTKSLAQIATDHNKTATDVTNELKNEATARIDQAVAAGRLTTDQANQIKASLDQRIGQLVNQVMPARGAGRQGSAQPANG